MAIGAAIQVQTLLMNKLGEYRCKEFYVITWFAHEQRKKNHANADISESSHIQNYAHLYKIH